jgi:predicted amidohydrolase
MRIGLACLTRVPTPAALGAMLTADRRLRLVVLPDVVLADDAISALLGCDVAIAGVRLHEDRRQAVILYQGQIHAWQPMDTSALPDVPVIEVEGVSVACLLAGELSSPERVRQALFAGTEVLLAPGAGRIDHRSLAARLSRSARAWENHMAIAYAAPTGAEIWDHNGDARVEAAGDATGVLDIASLRQRRAVPFANLPAQVRTRLYADQYARVAAMPKAAPQDSGPVYDVLMAQTHQRFATDANRRDEIYASALDQAIALAMPFAMSPQTKLVVFPEFFLQGTPFFQPLSFWTHMGIRIPGPETDRLAEFAIKSGCHVSCALLEFDPEWPNRWFNTAIIIAPDGKIILRYRKLQCADVNGLLNNTTVGNIYSAYRQRYGDSAILPVVDTPIGVLGTAICYDSNFPEMWRLLALSGAEVICYPTGEPHNIRRPVWARTKQAHAAETQMYIASANSGSEQFHADAAVTHFHKGHSALIDFDGRVVVEADTNGILPLVGTVDLGALRRARADAHDNPLADLPLAAIAARYAGHDGFPVDCFLDQPMQTPMEGVAKVVETVGRYQARGVYRRP